MTDPVTIGAFVSSALVLGAQEAYKAFIGEAVKGAYYALKDRLRPSAAHDVAALESAPTSKTRATVIAETIDTLPPEDQASLRALAQALLDALEADPAAIGLEIGTLKAQSVELGAINLTGAGRGARIDNADISGTFTVGDITVGAKPGK